MAYKEESRYRGSTITSVETNEGLQNYTILKLPIVVPESEFDFYIEIDSTNEFRPDMLSFQVYETADYGWAILEINNLRSFKDLTIGNRLRIPPLDNIQAVVPNSHDRGLMYTCTVNLYYSSNYGARRLDNLYGYYSESRLIDSNRISEVFMHLAIL